MTLRDLHRHAEELRREVRALQPIATVEDRFARYRNDPVRFVVDVLGVQSATRRSTGEEYQFTVLRDLAQHPRVAVRSGHGVGKSALDAWSALWWMLTRPLSRVLVVAPTFERQVRAVLFSEIRKWVRVSGLPIRVMSGRATVQGYGEEWACLGLPATEPDRIEGFHAEGGILLILDETKGIDQAVYNALMGALTSREESRLLLTSTPGAPAGLFYRVFTKDRDLWKLHHFPSSDSSQVSKSWIESCAKEWGEGSPIYQARVLGEFPEDAEGTLLPLGQLEAAVARVIPEPAMQRTVLGVDPARFGPDRTALAVWNGKQLIDVLTRQGMDLMETASWVMSQVNLLGASEVLVDEVGLGAGVVDRLRQLRCAGLRGINVARRAMRSDLFVNLRAERAWRFREALERGEIGLPDNESLLAELSALRYGYDGHGRVRLEDKDEVKKRVGRSPDLADAAILGFEPKARVSLLWSRRHRERTGDLRY